MRIPEKSYTICTWAGHELVRHLAPSVSHFQKLQPHTHLVSIELWSRENLTAKETRSDWREVTLTGAEVPRGTFSGPFATLGKVIEGRIRILQPFAFSDCSLRLKSSERRPRYKLCGPSPKKGFTPLLGQAST